jgi:putative PEP-CTERM system histidine kinase
MIFAREALLLVASLMSLGLAAVVLATRPRGRLHWSFGLGMVAFATETFATLALHLDAAHLTLWVRVILAIGVLLLAPWSLFVVALLQSHPATSARTWRLTASLIGAAGAAGALASGVLPSIRAVPDAVGPVPIALTWAGQGGIVVQLLVTVAMLCGLEAYLRSSRRNARWRMKYLILGLGGILLVRFYFLSQMLLVSALTPAYLVTLAATLVVGDLMIGASLLRDRLLGVQVTVSREILYRSVVVVVLGAHLLIAGTLGWVLTLLGIPERLFWSSVVIFVSSLLLAALLLSEDVRWRVKRFLARHFYQSKYDYREQWSSFTKRLGSRVALDDLAPQLVGAVTEVIGATKGALYLVDTQYGPQQLAWSTGFDHIPATIEMRPAMAALLADGQVHAVPAPADGVDDAWASLSEAAVVVPLQWRGILTGMMILGPERTGVTYTAEDFEFLATVAEQAAGAVVTTRLSETLARSREFEAFHRLTSFVIHDIKNAVSALSMLSRNALDHFDNPEFQRDAIRTLSSTVERMQELLGRLAPVSAADPFQFKHVDLSTLLLDTATSLVADTRVSLRADVRPVPPIVGDPVALERAFQNFITNAIQAMEGRGELTVASEHRNGQVVCTVKDAGCGMSASFLRKSLFVPFASTKKGGWGIGLYQAREIVLAHRGRIEVESGEGAGTTFALVFPAIGMSEATPGGRG